MAASQAPAVANTLIHGATHGAIGEREDLSDVIARIDPDETPIYSNMRKGTAKAVAHDWLVQELKASPDLADRAQPEGFEATVTATTGPVRHSNYTQTFADTQAVSDSIDNVDKAGRDSELAYRKVLSGLERRVEVDATIADPQAAAGPASIRTMATLGAWITNGSVGGTGSLPTGDGSDAVTPGTPRALTLGLISAGMQQAYEDGGSPRVLYMAPSSKVKFSSLDTSAINSNEYTMSSVKEAVFIGSSSIYLTDFGRLDVVVDRHMALANAGAHEDIYGIDPNYVKMCAVPGLDFHAVDLAKTGANSKFYTSYEGTLEVSAPKAHFALYAIDPSA